MVLIRCKKPAQELIFNLTRPLASCCAVRHQLLTIINCHHHHNCPAIFIIIVFIITIVFIIILAIKMSNHLVSVEVDIDMQSNLGVRHPNLNNYKHVEKYADCDFDQ